jgi:NAD(P)-dependent dehydrogenase (short-subunit alcohol dehydrogenase family)
MQQALSGKRALVTGGSGGIGLGIAQAFCDAGARVVVVDIDGAEIAAKQLGGDTLGLACDVRRGDEVSAAVEQAVQHLGGLDVLVNNAGVEVAAPLHEQTEEEFDRVLGVNLRGVWLVYKHAAAALLASKGTILNVASLAGLSPFAGLGSYCASKAGVVRMTEVMALELQPHGVRANSICPGFVATPMADRFKTVFEEMAGPGAFEAVISTRQGRLATTAEIGALAVYLASDAAAMITGAAVPIDGGLNTHRL